MQYPLISEYVKAIQDAGDNLDKLSYLTPVLDDHGEPYRSSGAFAVVFKMQDKSTGKYYALKCFTEEQEGRADAYRQIADELDMVDSSYITSVKYMEKELFVDSQCEEDEFPVLLMDWVDGETMEAYIAANYHNQSAMSMLCYRFGKMAAWLRSQSFAHGDVKPDNIIIRPDGSLTLVDYDGMFVSSMKGCKSPTIGTKDFSHPLRTVDDFDETIDDFSLASIALSLKAISMKSTLLDIYGASDRLLFSENDYRNPSNSKVISALQELICDKDFCTLYSLFMLALARKELSACSFRLFIGEKPNITPVMNEDFSTEKTKEELKEAFVDEWGVKYSKDGRKLLEAPGELSGTYSVKESTRIICDSAFSCCYSLSEIVIPSSVTSIGDRAFYGCSSLSEIVIPYSVTSIGDRAFCGCSSLKYIYIPKSVIGLNGNPFAEWKGKLECLSPNFIYEDDILFNKDKSRIISFRNQNIESYVIPSSVTSIGDLAFYSCRSLSEIVIPSSVTSIGKCAFSSCDSLSEIVIPSSVTSIGNYAFSRCDSLSGIVIPSSVTSIGNYAFSSCDSLSGIVIPSSVTSIGDSAFSFCRSLSEIVIPSSVTSIGDSAFSFCHSLSEIVIPSSVTSIGKCAFSGCDSLSEIVIPYSVTSIGDRAFSSCSSLSEIVIPYSVTSIGDRAFCGCSSLKYIYIPKSVIGLNGNPFAEWKGKLECLSPNFIYEDDILFNKDKSRIISFRNQNIESYVIPSSVTSIGDLAFYSCRSLSEIVIPSSVTSIGKCAFSSCDSLSEIVIPSSVTSIGDSAFSGCRSLSKIVIPSSVTSIGDWAFSFCRSLSKIVIPSSVTSIGKCAFSSCDSLSEIVIPSSVTSIGDRAFWGCYSLSEIVIPSSVTSIGDSAFYNCSFPNNLSQELNSRFGDKIFSL